MSTPTTPKNHTPGATVPPSPDGVFARQTTLRDTLIQVRERLFLTLPIAVLIAIGVAYHQFRAPPRYESTAILQVERPDRVVMSQEVVETSVNSDVELNTYLQLFSSDTLRNRVLRTLSPEEQDRLRPQPSEATGSAPGPDLGTVAVGSVPRTLVIRVSVNHRDPAAAAFIANRYAEQFIAHLLEGLNKKNEQAVVFLEKRAQELREQAATAERKLQEYMREHDLVSLDSSTNIVASRLSVVGSALQNARLERIAVEEQCDLVDRQRRENRSLLEISAISRYGSVSDYARRLEDLRRDRTLLSETYLRKHPKMLAVASAIATAEKQLDDAINLAVADLHATRARVREAEHNLEQEFAQQEKALFRLRDMSVEFKSLESSALVAKNSFAAILSRLDEATTSKPLAKVPVRQLDQATPSARPVSPNFEKIMTNTFWLGVTIFALLTAALVYFDDRIKSTHDIESYLGENLLGVIPSIGATDDNKRFRLVLDRTDASQTEPFMNLHATVGMLSRNSGSKTLLVTSTLPGEGKTMVTANLAATFAYHGRKTLLIDCDLRRPMLHQRLAHPNDAGLLTWFEAGAADFGSPLDDPLLGIQQVDNNLYLLTSGGRTSHPTPMFEGPAFASLIEKLKDSFDIIIIDSPPLGAVSDALYIAKFVDEAIYLCRFSTAARKHIRLNLRALRSSGCPILGLVLNGLSRSRLAYYSDYRHYSSYERYYGTQS